MSLSVCCQWIEPRTKRDGTVVYENVIDEKLLQLGAYKNGKYSRERVLETYRGNVKEVLRTIPYLVQNNIKSFRLSSSLFPLYEFCGEIARSDSVIQQDLKTAGQLFLQHNIRVTCHPGQFCVISSDKQSVIDNSIKELEYHAYIFDSMGLPATPYYAINIHGGKGDRSEKIIEVYQTLPENIKNRLTLENDEKCYNVTDLLSIHRATKCPIVLDTHHWSFDCSDMGLDQAISETIKTWGNVKPLQHLSNTEPGLENSSYTQRRAHSQYIHYIPEQQLSLIKDNCVDVDIEAKAKNLAIFKMREDFNVEV